jgi:hypothetical protein
VAKESSQHGDMVKRFEHVSQNHLNPVKTGVDGCLYPVYRVEWLKLSGFGIGWSKPNSANSSMAKNGLFLLLTDFIVLLPSLLPQIYMVPLRRHGLVFFTT